MSLPIGGGIIDGQIIVEPLADGSYLVSEPKVQSRYIVEATPSDKDTPASMRIGDREMFFNGEPSPPFWHTPARSKAEAWRDGRLRAVPSKEIYWLLKRYFEAFGDFEDPYNSTVLTLFAVETHIKPVLNSLFQLPIGGAFGSGKTAELLALADVSYHPFSEASATPAARTRIIGQVAPSYFSDEIDKTTESGGEEDNAALVILRTGYRRGMKYLRWDAEKNTWTAIEIFFPLAYTYSTEVEQAFKQRGLAEVSVSKSMDARVPVVNTVRAQYAKPVAEALFFWRLEFLEKAILEGQLKTAPSTADENGSALERLLTLDSEKFRKQVYDELVKDFTDRDRFILQRVFGREAELCYVALTVERALGVDVIADLATALNRQLESISSEPDARFVEFRRLLVGQTMGTIMNLARELIPKDAKIKGEDLEKLCIETFFGQVPLPSIEITITPILEDVRAFAKEHKLSEKLGPRTLGGWYKKLGIVSGRNKFHTVKGDILRIDSKTWEKINSSLKAEIIDLRDLPPEADSIDSIDAKSRGQGPIQGAGQTPAKRLLNHLGQLNQEGSP